MMRNPINEKAAPGQIRDGLKSSQLEAYCLNRSLRLGGRRDI